MNKITLLIAIFFLLLINYSTHFSQENTNTAGGESTGANGTISYSIGQPFYSEVSNQDNYVIEGLQQPYEISVISGIEINSINLTISAFPNPTTNYLNLEYDDLPKNDTYYSIMNLDGTLIMNGIIKNMSTKLDISDLPNSTYFVTIRDNKSILKSFKIIKH